MWSSRWNIITKRNQFTLPHHPDKVIGSYVLDLQADRPAVVVITRIHEREITFVAAHLLAYGLWWVDWEDIPAVVRQRTAAQNRQAEVLLEQLEPKEGIVIIECDCNSYVYRKVNPAHQNPDFCSSGWARG